MNSMRKLEEIRSILAEHKEELRREYKVKEIGIFGSYVGDEQKKQGDVDTSVEFGEAANLSLLDFIGFENYLSDILGVKADWLKNKRSGQE